MRIRRRRLRSALVLVGCLVGRVPFVGAVVAPSAWAEGSPGSASELAPAIATAIAPGLSTGAVDAVRLAVALLLLAAGSALHLWSKGCLEQNQRLVTAGPYRFTRNPFYLANLLVDLALCALIGRVWVALPYLLLWWLAYRETIAREEERLATLFPAEVARYFAAVPRLIPNGRTLPRAEVVGRFTFGNPALSQGSEYARILGFPVAAATIAAATWLRGTGLAAFSDEHAVGLALVLLVPVAWVAKLALAEVCRRPETVLMPFEEKRVVRVGLALGCAVAIAWLTFAGPGRIGPGSAVWLTAWPALWLVLASLDAWGAARFRRAERAVWARERLGCPVPDMRSAHGPAAARHRTPWPLRSRVAAGGMFALVSTVALRALA